MGNTVCCSVRNPITKKGIQGLFNTEERFCISRGRKLNLISVDFQAFSAALKKFSDPNGLIEKSHFDVIASDLGFNSNDLEESESAASIVYNSEFVKKDQSYDSKKIIRIGWLYCYHLNVES